MKKWVLVGVATGMFAIALLIPDFSNAENNYKVSTKVENVFKKITSDIKVQQGLEFIKADHDNTISDQIKITEIPAPSFKEEARAEYYKERLQELGLKETYIDKEGNVIATRPGAGNGPNLVVSAHLDTVFPEGTDTTVTEKEGRLYAPGIADDGRGLAAILSIVRAFNQTKIQTKGDIVFVGTVGEEGEGDLRGVKALFKENDYIDGFISIEPGSAGRTTHLATGSRKYNVVYSGPGGHSFGAFGTPSAIHALGRAISEIADLETPADPKTTFTVGEVNGGTSVNSIAAEANMKVDMRSNDEAELFKLEGRFLSLVENAAQKENKRWGKDAIKVDPILIGDRPTGSQPADSVQVQVAWAAAEAIGEQPILTGPSSTDANFPISLGIPSLTLGGGGTSGGSHSPDEWFAPTDAYLGVQRVFLTTLGFVGIENLTDPLLKVENEAPVEKVAHLKNMVEEFRKAGDF